jgi:hypothetical protein
MFARSRRHHVQLCDLAGAYLNRYRDSQALLLTLTVRNSVVDELAATAYGDTSSRKDCVRQRP